MTRDDAIFTMEYFKLHFAKREAVEAFDMAIKALSRSENPNTCGDAISRQAVLNEIYNTDGISNIYFHLADEIIALPPVKPAEKVGRWIKDDITERSKSAYKHKCDRCGAYHRAMYDYCPSCGARMFEPQESEGSDADSD